MTATGTDRTRLCGCCGRAFPAREVAELGVTPGVFVCTGCALWAARPAVSFTLVRRLPAMTLANVLRRLRSRTHSLGAEEARTAIPILPSADLDRTAAYWTRFAFTETDRYPGYLLLNSGNAELHFSQPGAAFSPGECFVHVGDARRLWKRLHDQDVAGIGPVADTDYGLREFVATDPDGNRIRFGSPAR
ncbi:VOC family protein [Actinoplanes sp. NPDC051411]|uniref:VOC family protein n=1 Tax=Actinoplanes sp. NPDC051411 TaxID=3155522 RepID=UPI0034235095